MGSRPSSESRERVLGIPACCRVASGLRLQEFAIFKSLCHCPVTISDMANANTLYHPVDSIAGTRLGFQVEVRTGNSRA